MLNAGTKLGPYEITGAIGAGGMGEVYRARDTRLDRIVAVKVLPPHLADSPELSERFEREARTIAGLNHPHICVLHDIGRQDGTEFLVMEYLEGETLAERLRKGPLPIQQALQYAIEIADALDKAHRRGITHRDLKPGNVMLTKSGTKLLDFGLAKLHQEAEPAAPESQLPTIKSGITGQGAILGTLQYMAPEQVEGKTDQIDARTDIFAFGAVVYEMATGKRAFESKSQASLIAKILETDPPPISTLQPMTPPALDRVVKMCLAKDRDERWQNAKDLAEELKWISDRGFRAEAPPAAAARRASRQQTLLWGIACALAVAVIVGAAAWYLKPVLPQPVTRTAINMPPGQQLAGLDNGPALALSRDGAQLAYVARQGGVQQIYLRAMDSLESKPVLGTEGAIEPFFSPDGQWLGFFAGGKLKKVSLSGGTAFSLGDAASPNGATWGNQGNIAFAPINVGAIQQISDAGGATQPLSRIEKKGENTHRWPEFLPGDRVLLFAAGMTNTNWTEAQVSVQAVGGDELRNLLQGGMNPRYAPSGHLVYAQGGNLMAVPFDSQRLEVTGAARLVAEGVLQSPVSGAAQYSFSATGSLVYVPGSIQTAQSRLVWVSRNGRAQPLAAPSRAYQFPRISPDGQRLAVGISGQDSQTWLYDFTRDTLTPFTFGGTVNQNANWSPDGKRIAFQSNREGPLNLYWQLADGSGSPERLTAGDYTQAANSWSADGQSLAFVEVNPVTGYDIWVLKLADRKAQPFIQTPGNESAPRFSPDGHWLAYISDDAGIREVYVQPYPGPGGKYQISTEGGTEPVWNPRGQELFYRSGDKMMVVDIATQPTFSAGKPRMLFQGPYETTPATFPYYDVSPDGQRFLMLKRVEQPEGAPTQIVVVQNWFEELKQKAPAGKK